MQQESSVPPSSRRCARSGLSFAAAGAGVAVAVADADGGAFAPWCANCFRNGGSAFVAAGAAGAGAGASIDTGRSSFAAGGAALGADAEFAANCFRNGAGAFAGVVGVAFVDAEVRWAATAVNRHRPSRHHNPWGEHTYTQVRTNTQCCNTGTFTFTRVREPIRMCMRLMQASATRKSRTRHGLLYVHAGARKRGCGACGDGDRGTTTNLRVVSAVVAWRAECFGCAGDSIGICVGGEWFFANGVLMLLLLLCIGAAIVVAFIVVLAVTASVAVAAVGGAVVSESLV